MKYLKLTFILALFISANAYAAEETKEDMRRQIEALKAENAHLKEITCLQGKNKSCKNDLLKTKSDFPSQQKQATSKPKYQQDKENIQESTGATANNIVSISIGIGGLYFGVNGGYGGGDLFTSTTSYEFSSQTPTTRTGIFDKKDTMGGWVGGGQIGYNYLINSKILIGAETDFNWSDINNRYNGDGGSLSPSWAAAQSSSERFGLRWIGTTRARIGYQYNQFTPYITGGLAYGQINHVLMSGFTVAQSAPTIIQISGVSGSNSTVSTGWVVGGGAEYAISNIISAKTEYLYTQLSPLNGYSVGATTVAGSNIRILDNVSNATSTGNIGFHQVRFGLNIHPKFDDAPNLFGR